MAKNLRSGAWVKALRRGIKAATVRRLRASMSAMKRAFKAKIGKARSAAGGSGSVSSANEWTTGVVVGPAGTRRFRLYCPPDPKPGERLPLMVMLHGCRQDAQGFANSTRMNRVAQRERFVVLYPEQDRMANPQACWNWFDTSSGRADGEAALILQAVDQVCLLHPVDRERVAVAGLSAGASMAALLVTRHPGRFKALVMHSGVPPGAAHSTLSALGAMSGYSRLKRPKRATSVTPGATWPPLMVIHGRADAVVSANNGRSAVQLWADAGGAMASPERTVQRGARYAMTVTDFKLRRRTVATLVEVAQLGHAWSGGAAQQAFSDARGPDASRMAWAFAARQFRA